MDAFRSDDVKRIYIYSSFLIIVISGILICVYYLYFGLTFEAYEAALNSFIVNLLVLVITVIVINLLFSHHHNRINKIKERNDYNEVLKNAHSGLVFSLKTYIITFITKEMAVTTSVNNEQKHVIDLAELKEQLDGYITSDFLKQGIKVTQAGEFNLFEFRETYFTHTEWVLDNNKKILAYIHKYLMLYSKLMPNDLLKLLVEIELIITRESAFIIPDITSFQHQINNNTLGSESIKEIKKQLIRMINKIVEFENKI